MNNAFANLPVPHFIRFLALNISLCCAYLAFIIPGVMFHSTVLKKTAYRPHDLLIIWFVPVGSMIVGVRTAWRYCASTEYWVETPAQAPERVLSDISA